MNSSAPLAMVEPLLIVVVFVGCAIYALPAALTLRPGRRPGVPPLTLPEATRQLRAGGKTGQDLGEAARALVAERLATAWGAAAVNAQRYYVTGKDL